MASGLRRPSKAAWYSLVALVVLSLAAVAGVQQYGLGTAGVPPEARGGGATTEENPEAAEQGEEVAEKHEAFEEAVREGKAGKAFVVNAAPAAGWAGEKLLDASADDWEPAIAADPNQPYVYMLATRYASTKPCPGNCPTPYMALYVSSDGGATWSNGTPLCACKGSGQFDPIIEVVPAGTGANAGAVYALYMNGFNVMFTKSTDHGAHWTAPVKTYGNVSWNDKPVIAVSDSGQDVYVSFNGPTGGDPYVAQSHDYGATWTQRKLVDSNRYFFAFDADVAPNGTVYFAESAILYGGGGNKGTIPTGTIDEHVFVSTNGGTTFTDYAVASVQPGLGCTSTSCPPDYYLGHNALAVDASGRVMLLYDGATTSGGLQSIYARTSTNQGAAWSPAATVLSAPSTESVDPAVEARGAGDFRAWYMQTTGSNVDAWNVYYRTTSDGGTNWSAPVLLSDATSGASYKTAGGFLEPYGDYGEIAITSAGKTIAIWGEGSSYAGPGGVWFNRQP